MKSWSSCKAVAVVVGVLAFAQVGFGRARTLIEMSGGKPTPALAKSWHKVKNGEYKFDLDTTKEVKAGVKVTPGLVKDALEGKLGSAYGVKVKAQGAAAVDVTYTGDEQKFLEEVAKTKIRGKDVEVALESSVSEGGIRAKTTDRPADPGEVKVIVLKVQKGLITGRVTETKSPKVKASAMVKIKGDVKGLKPKAKVFFKPAKEEHGVWVPVAGSLK